MTRRAVERIGASRDLAMTAAAVLAMAGLLEITFVPTAPAADLVLDLTLALCATVPLAFARSASLLRPAALSVTAAVLLTLLAGRRPVVAGLVALIGLLYLVARRHSPRTALGFAVAFVLYALGPAAQGVGGRDAGAVLLLAAALALTAGHARRAGEGAAIRAAARESQHDNMLAHVARGERARIARELHDIVAHHISTISIQAETARLTTPGLPPQGAERLLAIGTTARQALTEMRRLLGVLREDTGPPTRQPQPGLEQLIALVDEARETSGPGIRLIVSGRVSTLEQGLELTAYRIVQEALTNARRHAPGAAVDVELHYTADAVRVTVRDSGPGGPVEAGHDGSSGVHSGHGLLGMRERATMAGGRLTAKRGPAGGFLVEAVLPTGVTR